MALTVDDAIATLFTLTQHDEQPGVQGLTSTMVYDASYRTSYTEYAEVAAFQLSLEDDTAAINQLEALLADGKDMLASLYTYRSVSESFPQSVQALDENAEPGLLQEAFAIVDVEIQRLRNIHQWQMRARSLIAADLQRFSGEMTGPTLTHLWSLLRVLDTCLLLDLLKHTKAAPLSDLLWFRRHACLTSAPPLLPPLVPAFASKLLTHSSLCHLNLKTSFEAPQKTHSGLCHLNRKTSPRFLHPLPPFSPFPASPSTLLPLSCISFHPSPHLPSSPLLFSALTWPPDTRAVQSGRVNAESGSDTDSDLEEFWSKRWAVLSSLQAGIPGNETYVLGVHVEEFFVQLMVVATGTIESGRTLLFADRLMLLRVLPVLISLAARTEAEADTLFRRRVKLDRLLRLFKREPLVAGYKEVPFALASLLPDLSPFFRKLCVEKGVLLPVPSNMDAKEVSRVYDLLPQMPAIAKAHEELCLRFTAAMNKAYTSRVALPPDIWHGVIARLLLAEHADSDEACKGQVSVTTSQGGAGGGVPHAAGGAAAALNLHSLPCNPHPTHPKPTRAQLTVMKHARVKSRSPQAKEVRVEVYRVLLEGLTALAAGAGGAAGVGGVGPGGGKGKQNLSAYEQMVQHGFSQAELQAVLQLIAYIKGVAAMMTAVEGDIAWVLREAIHADVQEFARVYVASLLKRVSSSNMDSPYAR
ncbi:unnamed protein product [Closterium sp. NIES-65]|nr:unnamed protein product [Closterium sp. NIES-65]